MGKEEKVLREFQEFLSKLEPADEDELEDLFLQFMDEHNGGIASGHMKQIPEDAFDFLELAENAKTKKDKLKYISQALELEPGNLDALVMQASVDAKGIDQFYDLLQPILLEGERQMREQGYFEHDMGDFWLIHETRPYMRVREESFSALIELGRMKKAVEDGEELLKLCTNDNLGIRYRLMHLYAYLEDAEDAVQLHKRYDDYDETQMLLPLSVLYYKLGDLEAAGGYLSRLAKRNKDAKRFFSAATKDQLDEYYEELTPYGYRAASIGELLYCVIENEFLYDAVPYFYSWADSQLRPKKKKT